MEGTTTGSCLCGAVRYEVDGPPTGVTNCHCVMCRKQHGAAFATFAVWEKERFLLTAGQEGLRFYRSGPKSERQFCAGCGASLFWLERGGSRICIAAGTLDGDPGRPIERHIFVASKAPWYEITDDLPQFEEYPPHE